MPDRAKADDRFYIQIHIIILDGLPCSLCVYVVKTLQLKKYLSNYSSK